MPHTRRLGDQKTKRNRTIIEFDALKKTRSFDGVGSKGSLRRPRPRVCVCVTLGIKGNLKVWNRGTGHHWHFPSNEEGASRC